MTSETSPSASHDEQLSKLMAFTEQQQEKTLELINATQKTMDAFKPFEQAGDINTQVEELMTSVNEQLEKSMEAVNQQMASINQSLG
ncbi:hypothetical protein SG34_023845 [Thalassomonas viridans]|uniref:Uncharacterized protein n=1 Tax=Thalassomonas viridans TaxID=137584 RepID=A0AAE9Z344_9GAMM|nr:hypothetical protein [Thalassomonas viridans]WDE04343.1 hypothetical protein SG34_023845 [Thalassomonas viridans]